MKVGHCACGNTLFFENSVCSVCDRSVGFLPDRLRVSAFDGQGRSFTPTGDPDIRYIPCRNHADHGVCNWFVPEQDGGSLCAACRLNRIIPDLSVAQNLEYWRTLEQAKRHALYSILQLGLPLLSKQDDALHGLAFDFLADKDPSSEFTVSLPGQEPVLTGHDDGLITVNLAEADPVARTRNLRHLGEAYRTLLGHFRHEMGHYYWDRLIAGTPLQGQFRDCFGDERADYEQALARHYAQGPSTDWPAGFVSAYASVHPWEDWAETWAHYLHMVDTLETAADFGLTLRGVPGDAATDRRLVVIDTHRDFPALIEQWLGLSVLINALNRSMGLPDAYPFVLTAPVRHKLQFVHDALPHRT